MDWRESLPEFRKIGERERKEYSRDEVAGMRRAFDERFGPGLEKMGFRKIGNAFMRVRGEIVQMVGFGYDHRTRTRMWMECDAWPVFQIYAEDLLKFGDLQEVNGQHCLRGGDRWPAPLEEFVQFQYPGGDGENNLVYDQICDFQAWLDVMEIMFSQLAAPRLDQLTCVDDWIDHSARVNAWQETKFEPEIALILAMFQRGRHREAAVKAAFLVTRREHWLRRLAIGHGKDSDIYRYYDREFQKYRDFAAILEKEDRQTTDRWIQRANQLGRRLLELSGLKINE